MLQDTLMVLCYIFGKDNKCLTLPFQHHLVLHPSLRLGHTQPRTLLFFPDPLRCSTLRSLPLLCPQPGAPFLQSPSCQNPHSSRPDSNAAPSVKFSLTPGIHPLSLFVPEVNSWNFFLAYFILPGGILGCFYLFLPQYL